jgi:hypothetical protein
VDNRTEPAKICHFDVGVGDANLFAG